MIPSSLVEESVKEHCSHTCVLHSGGMLQLPKSTPGRVKSMVEQEAKAYLDLAAAYGTHSALKLNKSIEQYANLFNSVSDGGIAGIPYQ